MKTLVLSIKINKGISHMTELFTDSEKKHLFYLSNIEQDETYLTECLQAMSIKERYEFEDYLNKMKKGHSKDTYGAFTALLAEHIIMRLMTEHMPYKDLGLDSIKDPLDSLYDFDAEDFDKNS